MDSFGTGTYQTKRSWIGIGLGMIAIAVVVAGLAMWSMNDRRVASNSSATTGVSSERNAPAFPDAANRPVKRP